MDRAPRVTLDGEQITEILDAIPGAWERTQEGLEQARRGEGIPLDELLEKSPSRVIPRERGALGRSG